MRTVLILAAVLFAASVNAATRYAVPSGGLTTGNCDTTGTACTSARMLAVCVAGDTCLYRDGTYTDVTVTTVNAGTVSNRITIRAENRHQAIIQPATDDRGLHLRHSYITVSGLKWDGRGLSNSMLTTGATIMVTPIVGNIVEDNWVIDAGRAGMQWSGAIADCIIRWNLVNGTGYRGPDASFGEGFYLGSASDANGTVDNCELYGNTLQDTTNNIVDYKQFTTNANVHHNIFEGHVLRVTHTGTPTTGADDGMVRSGGGATNTSTGHQFNNNIVRNAVTDTGIIRFDAVRVDVANNVFHSITGADHFAAGSSGTGDNWQTSVVSNNTACSTASTTDGSATGTFTGNLLNQSQSVCDAEVSRILAEMALLPGNPEPPPPGSGGTSTGGLVVYGGKISVQ